MDTLNPSWFKGGVIPEDLKPQTQPMGATPTAPTPAAPTPTQPMANNPSWFKNPADATAPAPVAPAPMKSGLPSITQAQDTSPAGWDAAHPWLAKARNALSDPSLGLKVAGAVTSPVQGIVKTAIGLGKTVVGNTASAAGGLMRDASVPLGSYGLQGAGQAVENFGNNVKKPTELPGFGTVKAFSVDPADVQKYGTMTPKEDIGRAVQVASEGYMLAGGGIGRSMAGEALGQDIEKGKGLNETLADTAISGAEGWAGGKAFEGAGYAVGKYLDAGSVKGAWQQVLKDVAPGIKSMGKDNEAYFKKNLESILPKWKAAMEAGLEQFEVASQRGLVEKGSKVYQGAKQAAEAEYGAGYDEIKAQLPDAQGSRDGLTGAFHKSLELNDVPIESEVVDTPIEHGHGSTREITGNIRVNLPNPPDKQAVEAVNNVMKKTGKGEGYTLDEMRTMKQKLFQIQSSTEEGTVGNKIAGSMWDEIDKEMSRATNGMIDPINAAYSEFKKKALEVRHAWNWNLSESSRASFLRNMGSKAKAIPNDTMKWLEEKGGQSGAFSKALKERDIVSHLMKDYAPKPGDILSRRNVDVASRAAGNIAGTAALGPLIGPSAGAIVGGGISRMAGGQVAENLSNPSWIAEQLMAEAKNAPGPIRSKIASVVRSKAVQKWLTATIMNMARGPVEEQQPQADTTNIDSELQRMGVDPNDSTSSGVDIDAELKRMGAQ